MRRGHPRTVDHALPMAERAVSRRGRDFDRLKLHARMATDERRLPTGRVVVRAKMPDRDQPQPERARKGEECDPRSELLERDGHPYFDCSGPVPRGQAKALAGRTPRPLIWEERLFMKNELRSESHPESEL
jgi:hypothetical protein